ICHAHTGWISGSKYAKGNGSISRSSDSADLSDCEWQSLGSGNCVATNSGVAGKDIVVRRRVTMRSVIEEDLSRVATDRGQICSDRMVLAGWILSRGNRNGQPRSVTLGDGIWRGVTNAARISWGFE